MVVDRLFHGLPCVRKGKNYIIFSPYARKIAVAFDSDLKSKDFAANLREKGFFGEPQIKPEDIKGKRKVIVCTTSNCNLRCIYCFVNAGEGGQAEYLKNKIALRAIKDAITPGVKELTVQFFGGEPTMNFECIRACVSYLENFAGLSKRYEITTNGVVSPTILDYLIKHNFIFSVSIDGPPSIQNFHRPLANKEGSYELVADNIRTIVKSGCKIKARTTITAKSVKHLDEVVKHIASLGIKVIHFEPFIPIGRGKLNKNLEPNINDYIKNFKKAFDAAKEAGVKITQFGLFSLFKPLKQHCYSFYGNRIVVLPSGKLTYCLGSEEEYSPIAKMFAIGEYNEKTDSFTRVVPQIQQLAANFVDKIDGCKNCFAKYICSGVCPANNILRTGNPLKVNKYSCKLRKEIIRDAIIRVWESSKNALAERS